MLLLLLPLLRVILLRMQRVVVVVMMMMVLVVTVLVVGASRLQCRSEETGVGPCLGACYLHRSSLGGCSVVLG